MTKLSDMANIGKTLEEKLIKVGIHTQEDLRNIGSEEAFLRIRTIDSSACLNMLCALEGAIQGIRWHNLSEDKKQRLEIFYSKIKSA